jgi:hypothetical protein
MLACETMLTGEETMNSISPVLTEREVEAEQVIALGQEEYYPVIVARIWCESPDHRDCDSPNPVSFTRFRFSDSERESIAKGADLILSQPHHHSMMPVGLQLAMPGEYPLEEK